MSLVDSAVAVIAVWNPSRGCCEWFECWAMPFGASASVIRFNRCSAALEFLLASDRHAAASSYFDDFSVLTPEVLVESTDTITKEFFQLLGWPTRSSKYRPFEEAFKALGVVFVFAASDQAG